MSDFEAGRGGLRPPGPRPSVAVRNSAGATGLVPKCSGRLPHSVPANRPIRAEPLPFWLPVSESGVTTRPGTRAGNLTVPPALPAPSSATPHLSALSLAIPWKCHSNATPFCRHPFFSPLSSAQGPLRPPQADASTRTSSLAFLLHRAGSALPRSTLTPRRQDPFFTVPCILPITQAARIPCLTQPVQPPFLLVPELQPPLTAVPRWWPVHPGTRLTSQWGGVASVQSTQITSLLSKEPCLPEGLQTTQALLAACK